MTGSVRVSIRARRATVLFAGLAVLTAVAGLTAFVLAAPPDERPDRAQVVGTLFSFGLVVPGVVSWFAGQWLRTARADAAGSPARNAATTVFTPGADMYLVEFYDHLVQKIDGARECVYIMGEGPHDTDRARELHTALVRAVRSALERNVRVVRVQTKTVVTQFWVHQLRSLVADHPDRFELHVVTDRAAVASIGVCAIDPDDPVACVAQVMLQTPRLHGTQRLKPAGTAVFVEGNPLLGRAFRDIVVDLSGSTGARRLQTPAEVETFFRGVPYFSYGPIMHPEQLAKTCPDALPVGPVVLHNYRLTFDRAGTYRPGSCANLQPAAGHRVYGMLYTLSARDLEAIDRSEGSRGYRPGTAEVHSLTGTPYPDTRIYRADGEPDPSPPDAEFLELTIAAARAVTLPPEYVANSSRCAPAANRRPRNLAGERAGADRRVPVGMVLS